jgi:hypothetical protein
MRFRSYSYSLVYCLLFFASFCVELHGDDSSSSWHCYTGGGGDENEWVFADKSSDLLATDLKYNLPNDRAFDRRFHWAPVTNNITADVQQIAEVSGRKLYEIIYREKARPSGCPYAVVYALGTDKDSVNVRPFFAYFCDDSSERNVSGSLEKKDNIPVLHVGVEVKGNGMYYSDYTFTFPKQGPHFEGRADGGRKVETTVTK